MRESDIEHSVCAYALTRDVAVAKFVTPGRAGAPDRLFFLRATSPGWAFAIEFKAPGRKPSALQLRSHRDLRDRGITVFVVDDIPAGKLLIDLQIEQARNQNRLLPPC